jgi:hypothetical protein
LLFSYPATHSKLLAFSSVTSRINSRRFSPSVAVSLHKISTISLLLQKVIKIKWRPKKLLDLMEKFFPCNVKHNTHSSSFLIFPSLSKIQHGYFHFSYTSIAIFRALRFSTLQRMQQNENSVNCELHLKTFDTFIKVLR